MTHLHWHSSVSPFSSNFALIAKERRRKKIKLKKTKKRKLLQQFFQNSSVCHGSHSHVDFNASNSNSFRMIQVKLKASSKEMKWSKIEHKCANYNFRARRRKRRKQPIQLQCYRPEPEIEYEPEPSDETSDFSDSVSTDEKESAQSVRITLADCFTFLESDFRRQQRRKYKPSGKPNYSDMVKRSLAVPLFDTRRRRRKRQVTGLPDKFIRHITSMYDYRHWVHVRALLKSARYCTIDSDVIDQMLLDEEKERERERKEPEKRDRQVQLVVIGSYLDELVEIFNDYVVGINGQSGGDVCPMDIVYNIANCVGKPIVWLRIQPGLNIFQWNAASNIRPLQKRKCKKLLKLKPKAKKRKWKKPSRSKTKQTKWRKMDVDCIEDEKKQKQKIEEKEKLPVPPVPIRNISCDQKTSFDEWYFSGYLGMSEEITDYLNINVQSFVVSEQDDEKEIDSGELDDSELLLDLDWCFTTFLLLGIVPQYENRLFRLYFNQKLMTAIPAHCQFRALYSNKNLN